MPNTSAFTGIPNRDATPSIRGYVYQIYQSVLAWMLLSEDDVLILEGAEDFDVRANLVVVTTQVKHVANNVTLRTGAVVDAIQNFWIHQQKNKEFRVYLRFLTTAVAGCEQGTPFGTGKPGLEYWISVAQNKVDCEPLRQFLLAQSLDVSLLDFIRSASRDDLHDKLLARIQWDLGAKDIDGLKALIENKLKMHGFRRGVGTLHSTRALPHLLNKVADLLTVDGPKQLSFGDFLSSFEEATTEVIPRGTFEAMLSAGGLQRQDAGDVARLIVMSPNLGLPLPRVAGAIERKNLVEKVAALLISMRVVFLHGSSGVGKTNLASLVTSEIGGNWLWAGFRGRPPEQVQQGLARAVYELDSADDSVQLVLDDVEFSRVSQFEREFIALIFAVTQRNGLVLITGIARPPLQLLPKLWLPPDCDVPVPYFSEEEVRELLTAHGLTDSKQKDGWARVIFCSTSGHPQLVHARVRTLSAKGWPQVSLAGVINKSEDIERVRAEARTRLLQEFPSDATRLLAYRLSVVIGSFSRQMALAVGNAPNAITMPGEAFEHLVGPWIEQEGEDRYRVSPLLGGAAEKLLAAGEINAVHIAIAKDYLKRRSLNQYEVGTAFFHAFMAKDVSTLAAITNGIITADSEHMGLLYDSMEWFPHLALETGQHILEGNATADLFLRLAQFKLITASTKKENALKIIDRMEDILGAMEDLVQKKLSEVMVYGLVLNTFDLHIPSPKVVSMLSCMFDAENAPGVKEIYENFGKGSPHNLLQIADRRPEQLLFSYQATRISGLDDLDALITSLDELSEEKRNLLLAVCNSDFVFAPILISSAWLNDVRNDNLDVSKAIATLQRVESVSRRWGTMRLVRACQVACSVVYDEYGHSAESALNVLDAADAEFPNAADLINQRSKVLFHAKREQEGLVVAELALSLPELPNVEYVYTCRNAGIAAANLENWGKATDFFEFGAKRASKSSVQIPMGIGLMADAAIGYWRQRKQNESISKFVEVLELLEHIPFADNIKLRHLHATVRHCISWVHFEATRERSAQLAEPLPGMCSNQEPHEGMKDHRIVDISAAWLLLHRTEHVLGLDCGIGARAEKFSETKQPFFVTGYKRTLDFETALRTPPWDGVIPALVRMHETMHFSKKLRVQENEDEGWQTGEIPKLPEDYWQKVENWGLVYQALLVACINCLALHSEYPFPVEQWRQNLTELSPLPSEVATFLEVLEGRLADGSLYQEAGAALVGLHAGAVSVESLWKASFRILNALESVRRFTEEDIDVLLTNCWMQAADNQRFAFGTPSLAIPAIKVACADDTRKGLAKVATIIAVAAPYLSIRMAPEAKAMLEGIAAG